MAEERLPQGPTRWSRLRFAPSLRLEQSLSLAAFIMSLTIALINAFYALRGSVIAVSAPQQVVLYRDGEGEASVLVLAMRSDLVNLSDGYGDVLKSAELVVGSAGLRLKSAGVLETAFTGGSTARGRECELGARCTALPGLLVVERTDSIIDMPGAEARALTLAFPLVSWNCSGTGGACKQLSSFENGLQSLGSKGLTLKLELKFHGDGERTVRCTTGQLNRGYLRQIGWVSLACAERKVEGGPEF